MDCNDIQQLAQRGQITERIGQAELRAHVADCDACAALLADGGTLAQALSSQSAAEPQFALDFAAIEVQLNQAIEEDQRSPTKRMKSLPTPQRRLLLAVVAFVVVLLTALVWLRVDFHAYPPLRMGLVLGLLAVLAAALIWGVTRPLSVATSTLYIGALTGSSLVVPIVFALLPEANHSHPANTPHVGLVQGALVCLAIGIAAAAPLVLLWRVVERTPWPSRSAWLGVAACGGVVANLVLQLHCPLTWAPHLLLGHATVGLLLGLAAFVVSRSRSF